MERGIGSFLHIETVILQVEAMQRHPAKDILEEEEDGKYTKSGAQVNGALLLCTVPY